jgi:fumarylacetoacetase
MGVAIGEQILDLRSAAETTFQWHREHLPEGADDPLLGASWNAVMALGPAYWDGFRAALQRVLAEGSDRQEAIAPHLVPMAQATLHLPFEVAEYTDFYAGKQHATNVGTMFRGPENALPPNWLSIPIGYNGRASTVVVSGTEIRRPLGQTKAKDAELPTFGPSRRLDIELEMGAVVGAPSTMGRPVTVAEAAEMIFGYVLLNDWSARDIQAWEYQPLGPFQAKAFATTISPWIVTRAALAPFAVPAPPRERPLLPYLEETAPGLYDIALEVEMAADGGAPATISRTNMRELYYSAAQQLAHHASSGCAMRTGDLLGSGTISGPDRDSFGSLLEITWGGRDPVELPGGVTRTFIQDGDTLTLRGHAHGDGYRIGFGECTGRILPAPNFP